MLLLRDGPANGKLLNTFPFVKKIVLGQEST